MLFSLRPCLTAGLVLFLVAACAPQQPHEVLKPLSDPDAGKVATFQPPVPVSEAAEPSEQSVPDRVHFAYDSYQLSAEAREILTKQAIWLRLTPMMRIVVEGHCDERGTREYNLALGVQRANAVRDFLVSYGATPGQVETISYGREKPIALCSDESCWSQNRRAVSVIVDLEEKLRIKP